MRTKENVAMPAKRITILFLLWCFLASSLLACDVLPGITSTNAETTPGQTSQPLNTWIQQAPGVEIRREHWKSPGNNEDTVTILRIDPAIASMTIGYQPDKPLHISDWARNTTEALAIINGGYFDEDNLATGLLVSNGEVSGASYPDFGGMLAIDAAGELSLRSLRMYPYDPSEALQQATQSSPMLIIDGQHSGFQGNAASDRRTVTAVDSQGRLLLIVSPSLAFSLDELTDLLLASELDIRSALNLDGGGSTGMYVKGNNQEGKEPLLVDSITEVPITIIIGA